MAPTLDHVILLVSSVSAAMNDFASHGFSIIRGGTHTDGLTENALFILSDGMYVEVIAFLPPKPDEDAETTKKRESHWWWGRPLGFIDWALGPAEMQSSSIVQLINSAGAGLHYSAPVGGGRRTAQGIQISWNVSFPEEDSCGPRGRLPFFCEDVPKDSRYMRVPPRFANPSFSFKRIIILVSSSRLGLYSQHARVVFRAANAESVPAYDSTSVRFRIFSPGGTSTIDVTVRSAQTDEEKEYVQAHGDGVYECVLESEMRTEELMLIQSARFGFEWDE